MWCMWWVKKMRGRTRARANKQNNFFLLRNTNENKEQEQNFKDKNKLISGNIKCVVCV